MHKGNILLINPWIYDFAAYDMWTEPLGLLYIAGVLRENGYRANLINCLDRYHPDLLKLQNRKSPKSNHSNAYDNYFIRWECIPKRFEGMIRLITISNYFDKERKPQRRAIVPVKPEMTKRVGEEVFN